MPYSPASAAATSSWVDSGFDAHRAIERAAAFSAIIRLAVSVVTCRQAPSAEASERLVAREALAELRKTGICPSAHSIRLTPSADRPRSRTS